jgi:hypothetical protein
LNNCGIDVEILSVTGLINENVISVTCFDNGCTTSMTNERPITVNNGPTTHEQSTIVSNSIDNSVNIMANTMNVVVDTDNSLDNSEHVEEVVHAFETSTFILNIY